MLEEFHGFDQNDKMDAASFEKFKEKMRRAAAQIKAIKREETKRKKKEEELVKILLRFIKTSDKKDLVLLISRTLERNIPANFILAAVLLGNEDVQKEVGEYLMLKMPSDQDSNLAQNLNDSNDPKSTALIFFNEDKSLPLKVRIEVDHWIKGLIYQASESPTRLLDTAYDIVEVNRDESQQGKLQPKEISQFEDKPEIQVEKVASRALVLLMSHVIFDFLKQNGIEEDIVKLKEFSEFLLKGILTKTQEDLENRKELGGEVI